MRNEDLIQTLKDLPNVLSDKDKIGLLKILKDIKNYIIGYEPEMWDITIQGVLMDLFWDINKQPMILNLDTERNWQNVKTSAYDLFNNSEPKPKIFNLIEKLALNIEDTEFIDSIVSMYNERTGINGNMRYIPKEPIGVYAENDKRTAEMVHIEIDLSERNFEWFVEYYNVENNPDWSNLYEVLRKKYIITDESTFIFVMNNHILPKNSTKIIWNNYGVGFKADALKFADEIGFKIADFNKCFQTPDNIEFHGKQRQEGNRKKEFTKILDLALTIKNQQF